DVTGRNDLSNLLVNILVPTNRERATDYILGLSDSAKQRDLIPIVGDAIYEEEGIDGSKGWIDGLPTSDLRQAALVTVARHHSWVDLEEAIQLVSANGGDEKAFEAVGEGAFIHAARHFDEHDNVNQSLNWIETLPDGVIRSRGY